VEDKESELNICKQEWDSLCKCKSHVKNVQEKAKLLMDIVRNAMDKKLFNNKRL
jgi:hypothetical protein